MVQLLSNTSPSALRRCTELVAQLKSTQPEGSSTPLYRYRLDDPTLAELEALLLERINGDDAALRNAEAGALVMYCAHQFCRAYQGGQWRWEIAKGAIDPQGCLTGAQLYDIVARGLRFWGRQVHWNGQFHEYLYTLGREGGLPLAVLSVDGGDSIRRYLQQLLHRVELAGANAIEEAEELSGHLPSQLRQREIFQLAAELTESVAGLRALIPVEVSDPVHWLDTNFSDWHSELPLHASERAAAALIAGLVRQERTEMRGDGFEVLTVLSGGTEKRFERNIRLPKSISSAALKALCRVSELPARLRISLSTPERRVSVGMATLAGDQFVVQLLRTEPFVSAHWFSHELRLTFHAGQQEVASVAIEGGDAEGQAPLPWALAEDSVRGAACVVAYGSYATKEASLLVAVPLKGGRLVSGSGSIDVLSTDVTLGRQLVCIRGVADWHGEEDRCRFATGETSDEQRFELRGRSSRLAGTGTFAWSGLPHPYRKRASAPATRVPEQLVQWRPTGTTVAWQPMTDACLGDVQLRIHECGQTLHRLRTVVVPATFRIELRPRRGGTGAIRLMGAKISQISVVSKNVENNVEIGAEAATIHLSATDAPPVVEIRVQFARLTWVVIRVPFPSETLGFVASGDRRLASLERIGIDAIGVWKAMAVSCDLKQRFILEFKRDHAWRAVADLPVTSPGLSELPLDSVRPALEACLSGTRSIDASVQLRVTQRVGFVGSPGKDIVAQLGWHDRALTVTPDGESAIVELDAAVAAALGDWRVKQFRVFAQPLHAPGDTPIELQRLSDTGWFFSASGERLWLLTGWVGSVLRTRPRLILLENVPVSEERRQPDSRTPLEKAMRIADPEERREELRAALRALALDFGDPGWAMVSAFAGSLKRLPPPTYDVVCALASVKEAAVMVVLRQPRLQFDAVWDGLEKLGVSWYTVPIGLWLRTARLARDYVKQHQHVDALGGADALLAQVLCGFFENIKGGPRFFPVILSALSTYRTGFPLAPQPYVQAAKAPEGRQQLRMLLSAECSALRSRAEAASTRFPSIRLSAHECVPELQNLLSWFGLAEQVRFTWECLAAPLVAARIMVTGEYVESEVLDDLRLLRSFDEEWFDAAHAFALTIYLGEALQKDEDYFEKSESDLLRPEL